MGALFWVCSPTRVRSVESRGLYTASCLHYQFAGIPVCKKTGNNKNPGLKWDQVVALEGEQSLPKAGLTRQEYRKCD